MRFYNTPTRKVEEFKPQNPPAVSLYTCGPTVYGSPHIGNWVAYIRWDILVRTLRASGYDVTRVMNITDVGHLVSDADEGEDKMEKGARQEGTTAWEIATKYTDEFLQGMQALNLLMPEHLAKATEHIPQQIALIQELEAKGFTYKTSDGIYYDTSKFPRYAEFAHLQLADQIAGARVELSHEKRNPSDFALWKFAPAGQVRDMQWNSPWGTGFPGWHVECSAMAREYLGDTLDIHTGGIDHIPIHHTNEIAQSEAATGKPLANYWLHNAHLLIEGTKLAKSLGNSYTLADLAEHGFSAMDFRMFVMQSQYRTEASFTFENLQAAKNRLQHWRHVAQLRWQTYDTLVDDDDKTTDELTVEILQAMQAALSALQDDLNTPEAFPALEEVFSRLERANVADTQQDALQKMLQFIDDTLGLRLLETTPDIAEDQKMLLLQRQRAREAKDWQAADKLRTELEAQHINVRDTDHGVIWSRDD